jgi:hypothetical protein
MSWIIWYCCAAKADIGLLVVGASAPSTLDMVVNATIGFAIISTEILPLLVIFVKRKIEKDYPVLYCIVAFRCKDPYLPVL